MHLIKKAAKSMLPVGWIKKKLSEACSFGGGSGFKEELQGQTYGDYPFIKVSDMELPDNKKYIVTSNNWINESLRKHQGIKIFPEKAVVFAKVGAALLLNRRRLLTRNTAIDNNMMAAMPTSVDHQYLFYLLSLIDFKELVQTGAVPSINQSQLSEVDIPLASPEEQIQIGVILSNMDRAIEQTEAVIEKQTRVKTGLMQDLLTKGIDENVNIRSEKTHEFKNSPLGRIPVEWEFKTADLLLREGILEEIKDGNHGELHPKSNDFVEEGVPFIMATDIAEGTIDFEGCKKITSKQYHSLRIGFAKPYDVLLSHKASIGFVAVVPSWVKKLMLTPQVTYYRIRNRKKLLNQYLLYYMQSNQFQNPLKNLSKQSTRDYIGILAQRRLYHLYPRELTEQDRIATILRAIDEAIKGEKEKLNKLKHVKSGLMKDLLTGEVLVTKLLKREGELTEAL
jgi:type I restriction enzyme S subunit